MTPASKPQEGLSEAEARRRLAAEGPNALPATRAPGLGALAWRVVREPMFLLLIGASALYLVIGDLEEALVLATSIVVVMGITIVQERRTERALEALRDLSSPRALVIRGGIERRIAGIDVVRGDLLILKEGDRVPADAEVVEAHDLRVDESLLTGESVPVAKHRGEDDGARAYSGTLVVKGLGRAIVTHTGERSQLGRIGASLATLEAGKTSLERETARMVRVFAIGAVGLSLFVAALYVATRGDAIAGILAGITLAMAIVPEEFPVVLTVFLALGAWRIGKHGVLTRRMPAIEMLGASTVLCCDKTGTLTENRMALAEWWADGLWHEEAFESGPMWLRRAAALACELDPFDPMERAILDAAGIARDEAALVRRYPLGEGFLAVANAWRETRGELVVAIKGAPETVLALCGLAQEAHGAALAEAGAAATRGLRVLAVAWARAGRPDALDDVRGYAFEFAGLIALADPVRATVPRAVALCRRAGIRVVMITGDHPETARAIAMKAGIDAGEAMTGSELATLDDRALAEAVRRVQVFARVRPEQKLRLVNAYRAAGEIVAMTGDGVNDAPALKAAHIGIAMGARGTDVAREAASLVLLDDDFTSIVGTVRLGRRIYDNIRNAMRYLMSVHVPIAGMSFIPLLAGWPLVLSPVHVVFFEFVIDPACSIVFEAERSDAHAMERPPRPIGARLFDARSLLAALAVGGAMLAAAALLYGWALSSARPEAACRAMAFCAIVGGNLALILADRSAELTLLESFRRENPAIIWILCGTLAALVAVIYVPAAAEVFRFEALAPGDFAVSLLAGAAPVLAADVLKLVRRGARGR